MPTRHKEMQARKIDFETDFLIDHQQTSAPLPVAQTYFSIPQNLECLENINVLDYLRKYVWLSSKRQKKCKDVFLQLTKFNSNESESDSNNLESDSDVKCEYNKSEEVNLPMVFLGIALVDLFEFPATHYNMTELYNYLEYDKLRFREIDFRTWCGVSAFAERMVFDGPLECEYLEKADFKYLKTYGDWFDFSEPLQIVFDVIQKAHSIVS